MYKSLFNTLKFNFLEQVEGFLEGEDAYTNEAINKLLKIRDERKMPKVEVGDFVKVTDIAFTKLDGDPCWIPDITEVYAKVGRVINRGDYLSVIGKDMLHIGNNYDCIIEVITEDDYNTMQFILE